MSAAPAAPSLAVSVPPGHEAVSGRKMRLAVVTPQLTRHDGQGRVNLEIVAEALRRGHAVVVIAERIDAMPPDVRDAKLRAVRLAPPSWLPSRLLRDQFFAWRACQALARERPAPDAVLANGFVSWARSDVNAAHFVHASWLRSPQHPWRTRRDARALYAWLYSRLNVALEGFAFRHARQVVAVSGAVARDLERGGVPAARITTIANGVDLAEFRPGPAERRKLGLPEGEVLALFAGDLKTPRKNLDTVLLALAAVPGLHLAVAGRHEGTIYPALAASLGMAARVHFLGFRADMPALMRAADLFVFPSRYEPCGLVLLEALASGVPVVTTRGVGAAELIDEAAGVVLDDADDADALAAALCALVADPEHRRALARGARELAERHAWAAMAGSYVDLLVATARVSRHGAA